MEIGIVPVIPLTFAFFLPFISLITRKNKNVVIGYSLTALSLTFLFALWLFIKAYTSSSPLVYFFGNWIAPIGIAFEVDLFSATLVITAAFGFLMAGIYSAKYLSDIHGIEFFYTFLLGLEAGNLGTFMTGDAFNLFVMFEVMSVSAYAVIGFYRSKSKAIEGAFKYGISGAIATSLYFLALGFIYASFGTLNMADLSAKFHGISFPITTQIVTDPTLTLGIFFALTISMVIIESGIFPGHYWIPSAYSGAPIPIGAILSGFIEVSGIYLISRFIYTIFSGFTLNGILPIIFFSLGAITAFLGAVMMLVQSDIKKLLGYSTILNMGYLFMTLGVGTQLALIAINFHIINHAIAKIFLFFTIGAFIYKTKTTKIEKMAGVGNTMPVNTFLFGIAILALVGIPPFNVFFGKLLIFDALMQVSPWLASVVIITSAISAWAYFKTFLYLWRGKPLKNHENVKSIKWKIGEIWTFNAVNIILAILVVMLGLFAPIIIDKIYHPAAIQAMNYRAYIEVVKKIARKVFG